MQKDSPTLKSRNYSQKESHFDVRKIPQKFKENDHWD